MKNVYKKIILILIVPMLLISQMNLCYAASLISARIIKTHYEYGSKICTIKHGMPIAGKASVKLNKNIDVAYKAEMKAGINLIEFLDIDVGPIVNGKISLTIEKPIVEVPEDYILTSVDLYLVNKVYAYELTINGHKNTGVIRVPSTVNSKPNIEPILPAPTPSKKSSPKKSGKVSVNASCDPNDILGPLGFGNEHFIKEKSLLDYTIRFENDADKATAPAQKVTIEQVLDNDLDLGSFCLGTFGFGDYIFVIPENRTYYQSRLDLTTEMGLYINVNAGIDIVNGKAFWIFESIDPSTGKPPTDAMKGFLPPNKNGIEGQGFVTYSIKAKPTVKTGDRIDAEATIVFDQNEPIDTPPIFNTIDCGKPASSLKQLPSEVSTSEIQIEWTAIDDNNGSGIKEVDLYVSENNGEFKLVQSGVTENKIIYNGKTGHEYGFFTIARDNVGNEEEMKTSAETSTQVCISDEPAEIILSANPPEIPADGESTSVIKAVVKDYKGNTLRGKDVQFYATAGSLSEEILSTDDEGEACITLTSDNIPGTSIISATSGSITSIINVEFLTQTPKNPAEPTIKPTPVPTPTPEATKKPTQTPTSKPTSKPTQTPTPSSGSDSNSAPSNTTTPVDNHSGEDIPSQNTGDKDKTKTDDTPDKTDATKPDTIDQTEEELPSGGILTDINNHWSKEYIETLIKIGIISGYPDGTIKPDAKITRAEAVVLLLKALGLEHTDGNGLTFNDSNEIPQWCKGFIKTAVDKGVIRGYEDNTFRASNYVTREEVIVMLMNAFNHEQTDESELLFSDSIHISSWAKGYVAAAAKLKIIRGYEDNTFRPDSAVSRAEVFTMIYMCLELNK